MNVRVPRGRVKVDGPRYNAVETWVLVKRFWYIQRGRYVYPPVLMTSYIYRGPLELRTVNPFPHILGVEGMRRITTGRPYSG